MNYMITPYALAQFVTALISIGLSVIIWHRRRARGGLFLFYLFATISLWTLANGMEAAAIAQETKIFWSKIAYIGSQTSPSFLLLFAFEYTGRKNILSEFKIGMLFIVPLFIVLMAATNESHELIWNGFSPGPAGSNSLIYSHGILFWVAISYIFFLVFVSSYVLLFSTVGSQGMYKRQNLLIIAATIFPWIGSILYIFDMNPFPGLELISISFLFTGLLLLWAISKEKLLDVVPISHEFLVENIEDGILVVDEKFRIIEVNSSIEKMLKLDRKELIGQSSKKYIPFWDEISPFFVQDTSKKIEIILDGPEAEYVQIHISPLSFSKNNYIGWVLVMENITLRKKAEIELQITKKMLESQIKEIQSLQSELHEQAVRDALTGTFNRGYLDDTLARELARAERNNIPLSVLMIDVDNLKKTNDEFGHKGGDVVIVGIGKLLLNETRACDCVCRYGGDEFVVVAPEMKKEDAVARAEKWRQTLKQTSFKNDGKEISVTISIGIAVFPEDGADADALMVAADRVLYQAKEAGRNCVRVK
jgi:diguanylate cyclase (GGDEF)-like protein/PAS domain S-box-containing protein